MSNFFYDLFAIFQWAAGDGDEPTARRVGASLVELIGDWDELLATDDRYLVGTWIADARRWATSDAEAALYELNARNQITLWGPHGEIDDYAAKNWAGLARDYYGARWAAFVDAVVASLGTGAPAFNQTAFAADALALGVAWTADTKAYPTTATGDVAAVSRAMYAKWTQPDVAAEFDALADTDAPGSDLARAWTTDAGQLALLCDAAAPRCVGFTSTGYLKTNVSHTQPAARATLYVRR